MICIQFSDKHIRSEKAFLNRECCSWTDTLRHLGNDIDCSNSDMVDCGIKKEMFLCHVNKLRSNYDTLQPHLLINLFNSYCCFSYGSMLCKYNSEGFDKICKGSNIAIRTLLRYAHNYIVELYFLWNVNRSCNAIVETCMKNVKLVRQSYRGFLKSVI